MLLYLAMAFWAAIGWAFRARMASMLARAIAPTGAMFTVVALWTGALWGKPSWGTWWVWDARLTSELILLFLYLGYLALVGSMNFAVKSLGVAAVIGEVSALLPAMLLLPAAMHWWERRKAGQSGTSVASAPVAVPASAASSAASDAASS